MSQQISQSPHFKTEFFSTKYGLFKKFCAYGEKFTSQFGPLTPKIREYRFRI